MSRLGAGGEEAGVIREYRIEVARTARYATLGRPRDGNATELWFACHGYRQLARRFLKRLLVLDDGDRLLVAPEGLSRFYVDPADQRHGPEHRVGASWMTREDRLSEISDYVRYLDTLAGQVSAELDEPPRQTVVLGFSQGVHTVCRWVVESRLAPPDRVILWGAYLPPDLDMERARERLGGVVVTLVRGERDHHADPDRAAREAERLQRAGIDYRELTFPGGHELDDGVLLRLASEG